MTYRKPLATRTTDGHHGREYTNGPRPTRPWMVRIGFWLLLGIGAYYLLAEHRAHLLAGAWLPLVLLLCALMHVFMHRGHGGHGNHREGESLGTESPSLPRSRQPSDGEENTP